MQQSEVNTGRLQTIGSLLDEKLAKIKDLDSKVVDLCEVTEIADEIEAAEDIRVYWIPSILSILSIEYTGYPTKSSRRN